MFSKLILSLCILSCTSIVALHFWKIHTLISRTINYWKAHLWFWDIRGTCLISGCPLHRIQDLVHHSVLWNIQDWSCNRHIDGLTRRRRGLHILPSCDSNRRESKICSNAFFSIAGFFYFYPYLFCLQQLRPFVPLPYRQSLNNESTSFWFFLNNYIL